VGAPNEKEDLGVVGFAVPAPVPFETTLNAGATVEVAALGNPKADSVAAGIVEAGVEPAANGVPTGVVEGAAKLDMGLVAVGLKLN